MTSESSGPHLATNEIKFLIYGECDEYGSGAWCYLQTLVDMGYQVSYYSPHEKLGRYKSGIPFRIIRRLRKGMVLESDRVKHVNGLISMVDSVRPDVVIVLKGLLLDKVAIGRLKDLGAWVCLINHDDFFSLFPASRSFTQFQSIPAYDYVFCTKEVNVAEIANYNSKVAFFLFAYYPKIHHPPVENISDRTRWKSDVVFVGNCYPERVAQMDFLVKNIDREIDLKIYGPNWERKSNSSALKKYIQKRSLSPDEMAKAVFYSKASLGFLCKENRDDYTQRTFEIPAMMGVFLGERTHRHSTFYHEGQEALFFDCGNYRELARTVSKVLDNDLLASQIRHNGYIRVTKDGHTYEHRLRQLISIFQNP